MSNNTREFGNDHCYDGTAIKPKTPQEQDQPDDFSSLDDISPVVRNLIAKYPRHQHCSLEIRRSTKNYLYRGLYCQKHNVCLQWLNGDQIYHLKKLGVGETQI